VRFIRPEKIYELGQLRSEYGHRDRLAAVVVAAIYLATRFLLFLEAGVAPMNEPERRYVVAHEADRLTSAVLARFLLALA